MESKQARPDLLIIDGGHLVSGKKMMGHAFDVTKFSELLSLMSKTFSAQTSGQVKVEYTPTNSFMMNSTKETEHKNKTGEAFHNNARMAGITVETLPIKYITVNCQSKHEGVCGHKDTTNPISHEVQAGVDVAIATRLLIRFHEGVKSITVLTGDGDFETAIKYVANDSPSRVPVYFCSFKNSLSSKIRQHATSVLHLDDIWSSLQFHKPKIPLALWDLADPATPKISISQDIIIVKAKDTTKVTNPEHTVYVTKIDRAMDQLALVAVFESLFGPISSCKLLDDKSNKVLKYAYITFGSQVSFELAVKEGKIKATTNIPDLIRPSPSTDPVVEVEKKEEKWACLVCTLENLSVSTECEVCSTPNTLKKI